MSPIPGSRRRAFEHRHRRGGDADDHPAGDRQDPAVSKRNPRVVHCSLSGYGQTGPYAKYKGNSLAAMALSGLMYVTGDPGGIDENAKVLGVIQISRKGSEATFAGADFSREDLHELELAAGILAASTVMRES